MYVHPRNPNTQFQNKFKNYEKYKKKFREHKIKNWF